MKTTNNIDLNELIQALAANRTDDRWYEWRIYFRRTATGDYELATGYVSPLDRAIEVIGEAYIE
jgi:hypothetical protein